MNYWFAEMTNMDLVTPLFDYIEVCMRLLSGLHRMTIPLPENLGTPGSPNCTEPLQHQPWVGNARRGKAWIVSRGVLTDHVHLQMNVSYSRIPVRNRLIV